MAHLQQALADFGRDIGLPTLETGPDGSVQLRLESGALLGVAQEGEAVVVHWAEPVRYDIAALLLVAVGIAFAGSVLGLQLSYQANLPAGPAIVLTLGGAYLLSMLLAPHGPLVSCLRPRWHFDH